jgi:putative transposase
MAFPRSKYVKEGQEGVYHCFTRCVRRAFLYGFDPVSGKDFCHRKAWIVDRLRYLAAIFAIDVCAYSVMETHYHSILRTRPDIIATWSDHEVARRWLTLFPKQNALKAKLSIEDQIFIFVSNPELIAKLRIRLCSLSWFMGQLNEFIARAANKEDNVKGRFFESRFKCQALLDVAAIASCMVYVDLNPIRAGVAATPEQSDSTSIQERILAWQKETMTADSIPENLDQDQTANSLSQGIPLPNDEGENLKTPTDHHSAKHPYFDSEPFLHDWLCPISSQGHRRGILPMTVVEYLDLVDRSGRLTRTHKRGAIDADLAPILLRIGANPKTWTDTISRFGSKFHLVAGLLSNIRNFADQIGRKWLIGISEARSAFVSSSA